MEEQCKAKQELGEEGEVFLDLSFQPSSTEEQIDHLCTELSSRIYSIYTLFYLYSVQV